MRAHATAASHPACPAPTTTMSNCSVNCIDLLFYRFVYVGSLCVFLCETLCSLWLKVLETSPQRTQGFTEQRHRGSLMLRNVSELGILPIRRGEIPIACAGFV